jgi:hypothetical protein
MYWLAKQTIEKICSIGKCFSAEQHASERKNVKKQFNLILWCYILLIGIRRNLILRDGGASVKNPTRNSPTNTWRLQYQMAKSSPESGNCYTAQLTIMQCWVEGSHLRLFALLHCHFADRESSRANIYAQQHLHFQLVFTSSSVMRAVSIKFQHRQDSVAGFN